MTGTEACHPHTCPFTYLWTVRGEKKGDSGTQGPSSQGVREPFGKLGKRLFALDLVVGGEVDSGAELAPISAQDASVLSLKQRQQWIFLEMLIPNTSYELQVRVIAQRGKNRTWSPWSQPLVFRTRPRPAGTVGVTAWGCGESRELPRWVSLLPRHLLVSPVGSLIRDRAAEGISHGHEGQEDSLLAFALNS